ncbi:MAG: pilus assembly protein PilM [Candidatus Pacebacteria bacterium]|nr:pilus assembly protein PilM [Candidatus Paceibacterota bacterium]
MNILNLLTKEKRVAGVEVSDAVVRIAFLRERKNKRLKKTDIELVLVEEPINDDIIMEGQVADPGLLSKSLKSIWNKAHIEADYAIVSIPGDTTYSRIFSFPKSVAGQRLTEAMKLAVSYQLPMKIESTYLDWEQIPSTRSSNQIILSTIPKKIAESYIDALDVAGIKTLALETHLSSIARAIKLKPGQATIFTKKTPDTTTVFILKDGILRFSRMLPNRVVSEKELAEEIRRIKTAFEAEGEENAVEESLENMPVCDDYANYPELMKQEGEKSRWFPALGAVIRGQIEEGQDNIISLLPVGTEEAYTYQKAAAFMGLVRNLTIGVSVFFMIAFLGFHLFVVSLAESSAKASATLSETSPLGELTEKENLITHTNDLSETAQNILSTTPMWSTVLTEVTNRTVDGITISRFVASSINGKIDLTGIARDRLAINQFKKSLQESAMFTGVDLPITNLEQKGNVPFTVSFSLSDPSTIYYK